MKYSELKSEKQFLKKLIADLVSRFGDSLDAIAYSWMVFTLTGSAALSASTFAVNTLVSVILSPFTAALITNWNKKAIIVICDIGRGALVIITALLYWSGLLQPWMIITVTGLNSTLEAFRNPAGTAVFPQIVSREKFTLAMSLQGALSRAAELAGMALAGVIVGFLGITAALLIDASMFLVSAVVLSTLKLPPRAIEAVQNIFADFAKNTKEGFSYAIKSKIALAICAVACFMNFTLTPINALNAAYVNEDLRLGAQALSIIGIALTGGMGIGSIFVPKLLEKLPRRSLLCAGILISSLGMTMLAFLPGFSALWKYISLCVLFFMMGIGASFANTVIQISFMERIEEAYLARMSGIMSSLCLAAMPVASFMSAALSKAMSVANILLVFGIVSVVGAISTLFIKELREL